MFDQLKQMGKLQQLQKQIKEQQVTTERDGVKVTMNGAFEIIEVSLDSQKDAASQEQVLKDVLNETVKKVQSSAMQALSGMM